MRTLRLLISVLMGSLTGCGFGGESAVPERSFLLEPVTCQSSSEDDTDKGPSLKRELRIAATEVPSYLQSGRFVYGTAPRERQYYQYAKWASSPGAMITRALEDRLRCEGSFGAVHRGGVVARATHSLDVTVLDFFHDAATEPGVAVIDLDVAVVDLNTETLLAEERFREVAPLATFDASGAAAAFQVARDVAVEKITIWVNTVLPKSETETAHD